MKNLICALIATTSLFACAADDPTAPAKPTTPEAAAAAAPTDAVATLVEGGDYRFALDDSEVLGMIEKRCASEGEPTVCVDAARTAAQGEGVEVESLGGSRIHYVSYVTVDGERKPHIEANVTVIATDEAGIVELTDPEMIVGPEVPEGTRVLIEVVDENTIAMDKSLGHPRTGGKRLVFHRAGH